MKKPHYGIAICAGCTLAMVCVVGLTVSSFSVYLPYIIEYENLTKAQGSALLGLRGLSSTVTILLLVGRYLERFNIRLGISLAVAMTAASFYIYGTATGYWMYCIGAVLGGAAYSFGGMIPAAILIDRWFDTNGATAISVCSAGSGAAAIVIPLAFTKMMETVPLNGAFLALAAFAACSAVLIFLTLRNDPSEKNLLPFGAGREKTAAEVRVAKRNITDGKRLTWRMTIGIFLINAALQTGFSHIGVLYAAEGVDVKYTAACISIGGFVLVLCKCVFGWLSDRVGAQKTGNIYLLLALAGFAFHCGAKTGNVILAAAAIELTYAGSTLCTVAIPVYARDISNHEDYKKNVKQLQTAATVGAFALMPFPGIVADMTGSYVYAYLGLIVLLLLAFGEIRRCYRAP